MSEGTVGITAGRGWLEGVFPGPDWTMKPTLFVRPNLKVFLLGAALVVAVQHLITNGLSQGSSAAAPIAVAAREVQDPELDRILAQSDRLPASHVYAQLSDYYESKGDFRKALRYLRMANLVSESEADAE